MRSLQGLDAGTAVVGDHCVLFDLSVVFFPRAEDAVVLVLLHFVELDEAVTSQHVLGDCHYSVFIVLLDFVQDDGGVGRDDFDGGLALCNLAALDLGLVAFVHTDARSFDLVDLAAQHRLLGAVALGVNANHAALSELVVSHLNFAFLVRDREYAARLEVRELTGGDHHVGVDEETAGCQVVVVTTELTGDEVDSRLRQGHEAGNLLLEILG